MATMEEGKIENEPLKLKTDLPEVPAQNTV